MLRTSSSIIIYIYIQDPQYRWPCLNVYTAYRRLCHSRKCLSKQLQDGEQADAAEVLMAIFQALSEVSDTHERYHFSLSRCKALRIRTPNLNPADASAALSAAWAWPKKAPNHTQARPFSCARLCTQCVWSVLWKILARASAVGLAGTYRLLSFLALTPVSPALCFRTVLWSLR